MATNKYDRQHLSNQSAYRPGNRQALSSSHYTGCGDRRVLCPILSPTRCSSFDDYPAIRKRVEKLLQKLQDGLSSIILNGIKSEWTLANNKNSELARQVFGDNVGQAVTQAQYRRYFSTNDSAREAFEKRKVNGLNLSDR